MTVSTVVLSQSSNLFYTPTVYVCILYIPQRALSIVDALYTRKQSASKAKACCIFWDSYILVTPDGFLCTCSA